MSEKQERLIKPVEDALKFRFPTAVIAHAYDTDGSPYFTLTVGSGAQSVKAIVKIDLWTATTPGGLDGIGLTQRVYAPHIAQVCFDSTDTVAGNLKYVSAVLNCVDKLGVKVEVYAKAGATGTIALADIAAANLVASYDDLQYPLLATV